ncbi:epoxyqueuosine reductase QueH [Nitrosophilus kaiyonis]|uniref:epoxyqueuosine reductase QueH n=1 Tax=Nitrosophilus kaiyonis TaxID=2930200 RepID=UPI00249167E3|nr:epoxyqueuosine reductase QueH [Nitrosophilus kaiyonis]
MLVHICCSVDSHFFLEKLKKDFPNEKLIGFFYDPNIHPYSEYKLRLLDVKRSCEKLGIELIEGEYDFENWLKAVEGLEKEPEKGKRCEICFDKRLKVAARKAKELGEKRYTTTLLVSPLKSQEQLKNSAKEIDKELDTKFIFVDYRSGGGSQEQSRVTKEQKLYRQDYCGCLFGLMNQREEQNIFMDEMINPINNQILPASIEERLKIYEERIKLEEKNIEYKIIRQKFLNYRLLRAFVKEDKNVIPSYFLYYSTSKRDYIRGKIDFELSNVYYLNREEVRFIELKFFNELSGLNFKSVKEMIFSDFDVKHEIEVRKHLSFEDYDTSAIIVVDKIPTKKIEIYLKYKLYNDVRENLVTLR